MTVKISRQSGVRNGVLPRDTTSGVAYDKHGLPRESARNRANILGRNKGKANTQGKAYLLQENNITKVELLMLKGFSSYTSIAKALGLPGSTVQQYMERVHIRWETYGNTDNQRRVRGEALMRLNLIQSKLWDIIHNGLGDSVKLAAISLLMQWQDRMLQLSGITPDVLSRIDATPSTPQEGEYQPVSVHIAQAQRLRQLGVKLLKFIDEKEAEVSLQSARDSELVEG